MQILYRQGMLRGESSHFRLTSVAQKRLPHFTLKSRLPASNKANPGPRNLLETLIRMIKAREDGGK